MNASNTASIRIAATCAWAPDADCSIIGAAEDLPDGEYQIEFAGIRAVVVKRLGVWAPFDPPLEDIEEPPVLADS